jgi:glycine dehydrogenase subunit 2
VYFPLVVPEALMMEPTETESKETLDAFADTLLKIRNEDGELVRTAPHTHLISRADEVKAAKEPVLRWTKKHDQTAPAGAVTAGSEVVRREW